MMQERRRGYFSLDDSEADGNICAQPCDYISVGLRMEGDPDKIREFIKRLQLVGNVTIPTVCYVNNDFPWGVQVYARVNLSNPRDNETLTLYDRLDIAQIEINDLSSKLGETVLECDRLRQELGQLPKPKPWDAVLGNKDPTLTPEILEDDEKFYEWRKKKGYVDRYPDNS